MDSSWIVVDRISFFLLRGFIYVVVIVLFFLFILEDIRNILEKNSNSSISFMSLSLFSLPKGVQNIFYFDFYTKNLS